MKTQACDVESLDDFIRYYRGSYLPFSGEAVRVLAGSSNHIVISSRSVPELSVPWDVFKQRSSFGIPTLGIRNFGPTIAHFSIAPARQSNRGYIPSHIALRQFNSWESRKIPKPLLDSWEVALEIFYPKFYKTPQAIAALEQGERIGCSISPNVGVFTSDKSGKPLIAYKRQTVGYFDNLEPVLFSKHQRLFRSIAKDIGVQTITEKGPINSIRRYL